jgi:hypothetical protein
MSARTTRLTRRDVLAASGFLGLAAVAQSVLAACSGGSEVASTTRVVPSDVDATFAKPWSSLASNEVVAFGSVVYADAPEAIDHARKRFAAVPASAEQALADAVEADLAAGDIVTVAGWVVPTSLAGLAAGLAALEKQSA